MKQFRQLILEQKKLLQEPEKPADTNDAYAGNIQDESSWPSPWTATDRRVHLIQKMRGHAGLPPEKAEPQKAGEQPKRMFAPDPTKKSGPKVDFREDNQQDVGEVDFDGRDPPLVVIFKRKAIRNFTADQRVALYYSSVLGKNLAVPYTVSKKHGRSDDINLVS